jgi:aspartate/tyrosine/aromatic aminotransferase
MITADVQHMHYIQHIQKELELKIENELSKAKFELIQWMAGFFVASGLIQHFFK